MSPDAVLAGSIVCKSLDEANRMAAHMDLEFLRAGDRRYGHLEVVSFGADGWIVREVQNGG